MSIRPRVGISLAVASIAFSAPCFALYFAFTPILAVSAIVGTIGAAFAFAAKARRTAIVALAFGFVPCAQLLIEQSSDTEYFVLIPAVLAICIATWAIVGHSLASRPQARVHPTPSRRS